MNKNFINLAVIAGIVCLMLLSFFDEKRSQPGVSPPSNHPSPSTEASTEPSGLIPNTPWPQANDQPVILAEDTLATNFYVILDASGSMEGDVHGVSKMVSAKKALQQFAKNLPEDANLALSTFSPVKERLSLGTGNRSEFVKAVNATKPKGGTPLVKAIRTGFESLTEQARSQSGYGRYILLIVTDGASSDGDPSRIARDLIRYSAIEVQTIGFGVKNHTLNIPGVTEYYTANSMETLISALNNVLASEAETFVDPTSFSN
ncbi:MAG: vWA domain-containing protein [Opitutaceae bacterium]